MIENFSMNGNFRKTLRPSKRTAQTDYLRTILRTYFVSILFFSTLPAFF